MCVCVCPSSLALGHSLQTVPAIAFPAGRQDDFPAAKGSSGLLVWREASGWKLKSGTPEDSIPAL